MGPDLTAGLVFALATMGMVLLGGFLVPVYLLWRVVRALLHDNDKLVTAVLALSEKPSAVQMSGLRAVAEAEREKPERGAQGPRARPAGA